MATGTKTPRDNDFYNRVQDLHSRETSNAQAQNDQADAFERDFGGDNFTQTAPTSGSDILAEKARNREHNPDNGLYREKSSYAGNKSRGHKLTWDNIRGILKKRGPLSLILLIITGGGFASVSLLSPVAILPFLEKTFANKLDTQNTSATIRENRIIAAKITGSATSGLCGDPGTLLCRYTRPSNRLLRNLERKNIIAVDKAGKPIAGKRFFPNAKPDHFVFTDSTGVKHIIPPEKFLSTLNSNAEFRAGFHEAYNTLFATVRDAVWAKIKARFGFSENNTLADESTSKEIEAKIDETSQGDPTGASAAEAGSVTAAEDVERSLIGDKAKGIIAKLAGSGKGNLIGLVSAGVCTIGDIPRLIISTVRAYQLVELIRYGMIFMTTASALEAGKATPQQVATIGTLLLTSVHGKSAMDSFGMKYAIFGDAVSSNKSYMKFSPGSSAQSIFGTAAGVMESPEVQTACAIGMNPATGAAIDAATSESLVGPIAQVVGGEAASVALEEFAPPVIDAAVKLLPTQALLRFFVGDLTKGLEGEDVGNALVSAISHMYGQTGNARGNQPMPIDVAMAYAQTTSQVQLAYAQEDRATHSPFDPTNPNTAMGSIIEGLLPYYGNFGSISGILSSITSITTSSIGSILNPYVANAAVSDRLKYEQCDDPAIKNAGVAAGPFCDIMYGIPPKYLGMDPVQIVKDMEAGGDIDSTTGDPMGDYQSWLNICTDGTTDQVSDCMLSNSSDIKDVEFALYSIDHSIQISMDGV